MDCPKCKGGTIVIASQMVGPTTKQRRLCKNPTCRQVAHAYVIWAADLEAMLEGVQADPPFIIRDRGRPKRVHFNKLDKVKRPAQEPFNPAEYSYGKPPKPRIEQALCPHCADEGRVAAPGNVRKTVKAGTNHWRYMQCSHCDRHYHVATSWETGESIVHRSLPEGVRY